MISIQVTGLKEAMAEIKDLSTWGVRAAAATAMTRTAVQARKVLQSELQSRINKPTPYTVKALKYSAATEKRLVAAVGFDVAAIQDVYGNVVRYADLGPGETPAGKYMRWQAEGGSRTEKRFEKALQAVGALPKGWRAVPGARAKVNAYGNQSVGEIRQILSWFDAAEQVAGSTQNMGVAGRDRRRKGTRKTAGYEYFVAPVGGTRAFQRASGKSGTHKMQPGIYRRTSYAMGSRIEPVVIFVKSANYRKRFDFYGIAQREINQNLVPEFNKALAQARAKIAARAAK